MSVPRIRPRFQTLVPCHPQKAFEKFRLRLQQPQCPFEGTVLDTFIHVTVKPEARHYWSPVLMVQARDVEAGTLLHGHFGPHPYVWTLLLAIGASMGLLGLFVTMYGCAQLMLGDAPWALLAIPASALGMALVYGVSLFGQWRAHAQMQDLKSFFDISICAQEMAAIERARSQAQDLLQIENDKSCVQCRQLCKS
ncbi:MAG: hypothetical protein AB7I41_21480 [Candidatus Sericytochromatia bacterium]